MLIIDAIEREYTIELAQGIIVTLTGLDRRTWSNIVGLIGKPRELQSLLSSYVHKVEGARFPDGRNVDKSTIFCLPVSMIEEFETRFVDLARRLSDFKIEGEEQDAKQEGGENS